jgi:hypothetical protein
MTDLGLRLNRKVIPARINRPGTAIGARDIPAA